MHMISKVIMKICVLFILVSQTWSLAPKICKDCKFFGEKSLCKKIGELDLVSGKSTYQSAQYRRTEQCGKEAIYFEENEFKVITLPYYFVKENFMLIFTVMLTSLYGYAAIFLK